MYNNPLLNELQRVLDLYFYTIDPNQSILNKNTIDEIVSLINLNLSDYLPLIEEYQSSLSYSKFKKSNLSIYYTKCY